MDLGDYIIFEIFTFILPICKYHYKHIINLLLCSKIYKKMILNFYKDCIVFRIRKKNKNVLGFRKLRYCLKHSKIPLYIFTQLYKGSLSPLSRSIPFADSNLINNFTNINNLNTIPNRNNYFKNTYYIHFDKLSHSKKFIELVNSNEINLDILHQCCQGLGFRVKYFK